MAQGEGFKHITVTAPDEDDVVIVAGASDGGEMPRSEEEPQEAALATPDAAPPMSGEQKAGSHRETTLADLEHDPMPLAQRIVIVAAIVCIIGAVIYYMAFMR